MVLFVFADNEFQLGRENPHQLINWITELSREVLQIYARTDTLKEIYRNTKQVVSFLQHAVEDSHGMDVTCANPMYGDGIHCVVMENLWTNVPENSLVEYLRPLLVLNSSSQDTKYQVTDVAVLLDAGYTDGEIVVIQQILQAQLPRISTHAADKFPREGIVVDRIESFIGLDAGLCIFLLSSEGKHHIIAKSGYRVFTASRAISKAVYVVSEIDPAFAHALKFDHFVIHVSRRYI